MSASVSKFVFQSQSLIISKKNQSVALSLDGCCLSFESFLILGRRVAISAAMVSK